MQSAFLGFGSEEALRHIADAIADGLFTTDAAGIVTYWSPAAERITGWSRQEAIGTPCSILAGDTKSGCSCGLGPIKCGLALSGRSSKRCTIRTKDGRLLVIVKSAVPIRNAAGDTVGALESFTVVGEEREPAACTVDEPAAAFGELVGQHPAMQDVYRMIRLVASSDATVMIVGESGTGKERIAEAIHRLGARAGAALVRIPCAELGPALGAALLETAASGGPPTTGLLGEAHGGTLLLDEVGDLSAADQISLLRILERREASRARDPVSAKRWFRVLCATHSDLKKMVDAGRFRADLYFRLNVFPLRAPPLREHLSDVPLLAERIANALTPPAALTPESLGPLMTYDWPGNVRELQNVVEFAAMHAAGAPVLPDHFPAPLRAATARLDADERTKLLELLAAHGGNRTLAAKTLGVSRVTLWKRLRRHGLVDRSDQ